MNTSPFRKILDTIGNITGFAPERNSAGYTSRCPAHDDRNPSLSIKEGDDGRVLLHCHAGCPPKDVVRALGLEMRDLMPDKKGAVTKTPVRDSKRILSPSPQRCDTKTFRTACDAIADYDKHLGQRRTIVYPYLNAASEPVGAIARWDLPDRGKEIRPVRSTEDGRGWVKGAMSPPRPLYRLPELSNAKRVYICEGEKAAEAVRRIGLISTTSSGGSKAAKDTDWQPLAGKECIILPDNDEPGRAYAEDVTKLLRTVSPAPIIKQIELPGLDRGEDVFEYIESLRKNGLDNDAIRSELEKLSDEAELIEPDPPFGLSLQCKPFPLEVLPPVLARFIDEIATSQGCDPAMVALPAITTVAASIGASRSIKLKEGWAEPSIVWSMVVAPSGSKKSPAFSAAIEPLREIQREAFARYERDKEDQEALAKTSRDKQTESEMPGPERYIVQDCTIESLAPIFRDNPRGLLVAHDEASGWMRAFNQYKGGKGADESSWLQIFNGGEFTIDRKTGDQKTIHVPVAVASVCGTIQPGILESLLTSDRIESGMAARILLACPPKRRKHWNESSPSEKAIEDYHVLIRRLVKLKPIENEYRVIPVQLPLTKEAGSLWGKWYDIHAERQYNASTDRESAAFAKLEAYAARFALILALAENPDAELIDAIAMQRAIVLVEWFINESIRLSALSEESEDQHEQRRLIELIRREGGKISVRELMRRSRSKFPTAADAKAVLDPLVGDGILYKEDLAPESGSQAGRRSEVYRLTSAVTVTKSTETLPEGFLSPMDLGNIPISAGEDHDEVTQIAEVVPF